MPLTLDHVFVCCSPGAPEGDALLRLGLREGSGNRHPGQGTANRRFFLDEVYLELLWVSDPAEAQSESTRPTRLWERWSARESGASPFGLAFRPSTREAEPAPFPTWSYRPRYLPPGQEIEIARGTPLEEPELLYLPFASRAGPGMRGRMGLTVHLPGAASLSAPSRAAQAHGLVAYRRGPEHALELRCLAGDERSLDLRPALPLLLAPQTV